MQPSKHSDTTKEASSGPSVASPPSNIAGNKRARDETTPTDYYNIPGMSDLTEREQTQNEILSKRYHKKE